jgi:hypothetical protein
VRRTSVVRLHPALPRTLSCTRSGSIRRGRPVEFIVRRAHRSGITCAAVRESGAQQRLPAHIITPECRQRDSPRGEADRSRYRRRLAWSTSEPKASQAARLSAQHHGR